MFREGRFGIKNIRRGLILGGVLIVLLEEMGDGICSEVK